MQQPLSLPPKQVVEEGLNLDVAILIAAVERAGDQVRTNLAEYLEKGIVK